jgi:hypothetical protein
MRMMTVSVKHACAPTAFDAAVLAACFAGWVPKAAFDACVTMLAAGMTAAGIEWAFRDCAKRIQ